MAGRKTLLVEGTDDEHVLMHLCGNHGVPKLDDIVNCEGVDQLIHGLPLRLELSEDGDILGVVVDADTDLTSRWQSLRKPLVDAGYGNVPDSPAPDGTIVDPPIGSLLPRVGVWIMPDNQTPGILEDFLRFLVPQGSRLLDHVESSVATIPPDERRFSDLAKPKAIIHTWLAWQKEPGKPLGTAITARYLDPSVSQVELLMSWLNRLFFP